MSQDKYKEIKHKLIVKKSSTGLGLYTKEELKKGEFVVEYKGPILTRKIADDKGGKYLFETSHNRFIDGTGRDNIARYINHSCRPNCEVDVRKGRVLVFTKRKINNGEQLSYDYGKEYFDEFIKPFGCKCNKCLDK